LHSVPETKPSERHDRGLLAPEHRALYEKAQVVAHEEAPWIAIAHSVRFDPVRKEVIGYKMDATAHHYFDKVDMADK
jgi:dipeptide transport system substrate-binding protein